MLPPFLLGMLAAQHVNAVGELYLGEVLGILLLLPIIFGNGRLSQTERRLLLFGALWAGAQALSDVQNVTAVNDSLKGVFAPLVFVATITGLSAYFRANVSRMPSFLLGAALGAFVGLILSPTEFFSQDPWKWGAGSVVLGVFSIHYSFFLRRKSLAWLLFGLVGFLVVSLHYEARTLGALPLLAGLAYAFLRVGRVARFVEKHSGKWGVARVVPLIVAGILVLNVGATVLFSSDFVLSKVSPVAAQKDKAQASGRLGILFGGRQDMFASIHAFVDKPLLGHGSWAKDTSGYGQQSADTIYRLGYSQSNQNLPTSPWIPTHSYLMGALVWAGIMGGLFWIVLLLDVLGRFLKAMGWLPVYFYIYSVGFLWDILFSPFGASARWGTAVFLAAFFVYASSSRVRRVAS